MDISGQLREMADLFDQRNAHYGNNFKMVAPIVKVLFPEGVPREVIESDAWHLFELKLVKLSRFAILWSKLAPEKTGLLGDDKEKLVASLVDSIKDDTVYSAMVTRIIQEEF